MGTLPRELVALVVEATARRKLERYQQPQEREALVLAAAVVMLEVAAESEQQVVLALSFCPMRFRLEPQRVD